MGQILKLDQTKRKTVKLRRICRFHRVADFGAFRKKRAEAPAETEKSSSPYADCSICVHRIASVTGTKVLSNLDFCKAYPLPRRLDPRTKEIRPYRTYLGGVHFLSRFETPLFNCFQKNPNGICAKFKQEKEEPK